MVYFLCKAYDSDRQNCYSAQSLPVRGAWIEIISVNTPEERKRRSPCGERGLKSRIGHSTERNNCRSPCGERGLKFHDVFVDNVGIKSLPVRGAWIEILLSKLSKLMCNPSLPVRGAWIEIA